LCLWALVLPFLSPSFAQPPDPSQIPEPQIVYALHAVWVPDKTVTPATPKCVTEGTVAAPHFHFYTGWKDGAPAFFSIDWILIKELTSTHEPQVYYLENPQSKSGLPSDCTKVPVSDPEKWNWTSWEFWPWSAGSEGGVGMHNATYKVTVQWRYGVYMKGPRGPFQTSITINVQNLVVIADPRKLLKWDPDRPNVCDTTISYNLQCAQRKLCRITFEVYDLLYGQKVYEETQVKECPRDDTWIWNGKRNVGFSDFAPWGLYTFNISVEGASPYDRDSLRSDQIKFLRWVYTRVPAQVRGGVFAYEESIFQIAYALGSSKVSQRTSNNDCKLYYKSVRLEDWLEYGDKNKVPLLIPMNTQSFTCNDYDLIDWLPILSGRPGNWVLVLEAEEGKSYTSAYKNHIPKWALPVGGEVITPSAACFDYHIGVGNVGNKLWNVLPFGALLECTQGQWIIKEKTEYYTRYHDWRWWDASNKQFITEPINFGSGTIETMMKALRRVGIWFYIGHSTYTYHNAIPYLLFGQAIWGENGFILSSAPPLLAYNDYYRTTISWTPNPTKYRWYAISNLPNGDLSQLKLAVIVACHGAGGDFPRSYPLLDQIVAKGCPLALGLVMNAPLTAGKNPPPGINIKFAINWSKKFWDYVANGVKDPIRDENGNILQSGGRWDVLAAANKALEKAGTRPRRGPYNGTIEVDGPSILGKRPYSVYFVYQPTINPFNYYISPAQGGRDDRLLRVIQISNLYP